MVRQMVHLNTWSSRGQRTRQPHVMQLPVLKSLLPPVEKPGRWPRVGGLALVLAAVETEPASSPEDSSTAIWPDFFFLLENSEGKGWLMERAWRGRCGGWALGWRSWSSELESSALMW